MAEHLDQLSYTRVSPGETQSLDNIDGSGDTLKHQDSDNPDVEFLLINQDMLEWETLGNEIGLGDDGDDEAEDELDVGSPVFMSQCDEHRDSDEKSSSNPGQKCSQLNILQTGPRKCLSVQDPLVHHGHHFGHVVHSFCNIQTLLTNGMILMGDLEERGMEALSQQERKESTVFCELLKMVPQLEQRLMASSEEEVVSIAELIQKGASSARDDDMKSMKVAIIDWITPKDQILNPHIPQNVKTG
ncbi:hypothetical protein PAXINDRAFT_8015 [Paxillus involutus ATCC 200175]|nr:hypothetical protein PAXINDRAFT_8015 [Paxillus involutus ATCC 200175]